MEKPATNCPQSNFQTYFFSGFFQRYYSLIEVLKTDSKTEWDFRISLCPIWHIRKKHFCFLLLFKLIFFLSTTAMSFTNRNKLFIFLFFIQHMCVYRQHTVYLKIIINTNLFIYKWNHERNHIFAIYIHNALQYVRTLWRRFTFCFLFFFI